VFTGLSASYAPFRHFALGIDNVTVQALREPRGMRWAVSAGPFAEAFTFFGSWAQPYLQAGVAIQERWGGGFSTVTGWLPFAGAGFRFWIAGRFSIGVGARASALVSEGYEVGSHVLPGGTFSIAGGLDLAAHL
jgi:hypothetical protein